MKPFVEHLSGISDHDKGAGVVGADEGAQAGDFARSAPKSQLPPCDNTQGIPEYISLTSNKTDLIHRDCYIILAYVR